MLDRRGFLKASLLSGSLPTLGLLPNALANGIDVRTIIDGACTDVRSFAVASGAIACGADAAQLFSEFARDGAQCWFGLTRDSHYFIIEQLAVGYGYRGGYLGVHDYRNGALRHTLRGAHHTLPVLASAMAAATANWTQTLAAAVPLLAATTTRDHHLELRTAVTRPADSGGYLVSWCLQRA